MISKKSQWGLFPFLLSILFAGLTLLLLYNYNPANYAQFYTKGITYSGIVISFLAFFIGHLSYPRVHNLKVYLIGYLTGSSGIFYYIIFNFPRRNEEAVIFLFLLNFTHIIAIFFIPSYVKYRITQQITYIVAFFEVTLLSAVRFLGFNFSWTHHFSRITYLDLLTILTFVWICAVIIISSIKLKNEFHLGGIFCGFAFLIFLSWMSPFIAKGEDAAGAEKLLFTSAVIYLEIGIVFHWFSRMEHRISYDPLLQIYNRNYCSKIIEEQSQIKTKPPFGVAMVDIDHFKNVNDNYGHQAGDKVLFQVAQVILREIIPDGIACRYGGEEIIIFFPKKATKEIVTIMEKVRKAIETTKIPIKRKKLTITASCGISHRDSSSQKIMDIIHAADKALYRAKKGGRNLVRTGKTISCQEKKK